MYRHARFIILMIGVVLVLSAGLLRPVHAQDDEDVRIYVMARDLHYEDIKLQNFTSWVDGNMGNDSSGVPDKLQLGQPIPDFDFKLFNQDGEISKATLKGPYLLNFWASWCPPCREEFPRLVNSIDDGKLDVPVVFVNVFDKKADAQRFLQSIKTKVTIATDAAIPNSSFAFKYGLKSIPQTILVDADGNIQAIHSGGMTDLAVQFMEEIAKNPGVGAFDASDPEQMPSDAPPASIDQVTTHVQ